MGGPVLNEDDELRLDGLRAAALYGDKFCENNMADLKLLVLVYSDADAEELLRRLRSRFWEQNWINSR